MLGLIGFLNLLALLVAANWRDVSEEYSRTIWSFFSPDASPYISELLSITATSVGPEWKLIFLTPSNLSDYLDVKAFPPLYSRARPQFQSDYIRTLLISRYGGWWMDASSVITSNQLLEKFRTECIDGNVDWLGFGRLPNLRIPPESALFYGKKNSVVVTFWAEELHRALLMGLENYVLHAYRTGVSFTGALFPRYPRVNTYFTVEPCLQVVLQRRIPRKTPIILYNRDHYMYKLASDCRWNMKCIKNKLVNRTELLSYPMTKLHGGMRRLVDKRKLQRSTFIDLPLKYGSTVSNRTRFEFQSVLLLKAFTLVLFFVSIYSTPVLLSSNSQLIN